MKAKVTSLLFALMMLPVLAFADVKVTGTVTDNSGEPLIGVAVIVNGASMGTQTNIDGEYSINVPEGGVLKFSCIGYHPPGNKIYRSDSPQCRNDRGLADTRRGSGDRSRYQA